MAPRRKVRTDVVKKNQSRKAAVEGMHDERDDDASGSSSSDEPRPVQRAKTEDARRSKVEARPARTEVALSDVRSTSLLITTKAGTFTMTVHLPPAVARARKPLLLLAHGFPDTAEPSFTPLAAELVSAGYGVAIPHLRGYESPTIQRGCSRSEYFGCDLGLDILELVAVLKARGYCDATAGVVLVGHDWGSVAVQQATSILFEAHYELASWRQAGDDYSTRKSQSSPGEPSIVDVLPKSVLRGTVLIAVPPLQHFLRGLLRFPVQLLMSWYIFFFQLPWLPEWAIRCTGLLAWLWHRWSPSMGREEATTRANAVRDHLSSNGRPANNSKPPLALAQAVDQRVVHSSSASSKSSHGSSIVAALAYYRCLLNFFYAKARYSLYVAMSNDHEYLAARALPTLALNGDQDGCIDPRLFAFCSKEVRHLHGWGVEHKVISGTGHWPHLEQPSETARAIIEFLQRRKLDRPKPVPRMDDTTSRDRDES